MHTLDGAASFMVVVVVECECEREREGGFGFLSWLALAERHFPWPEPPKETGVWRYEAHSTQHGRREIAQWALGCCINNSTAKPCVCEWRARTQQARENTGSGACIAAS